MANPQPEQFTKISNELLEALSGIRIAGEARQVLDVIIRQTYGFHRKEALIPLGLFVKYTHIDKPNINRGIRHLIKMNMVIKLKNDLFKINKDYETKNIIKKVIVNNDNEKQIKKTKKLSIMTMLIVNNDNPIVNNDNPHIIKENIKDIVKENSTEANMKIVNNDNIPYQEIIQHLNNLTGKRFNFKSTVNRKLIKSRFNEGFTKEDFFEVHQNKFDEWKNSEKMFRYLTPTTLYAQTHFDAYLNQNTKPKEDRHPDAPRY